MHGERRQQATAPSASLRESWVPADRERAGGGERAGRRLAAWTREHWGLAIFLLALVLRCAFMLSYGLSAPPIAWGDDTDYDAIARGLAGPAHLYQNTWFPPGYPLFLALVYGLAGPLKVAAVRLIQAVLSAATCWLTYAIARHAFGAIPGRVAGLLLALYPGHVYMAWRLMAETLFTLLIALAVLATQRALARFDARERTAWPALWTAAGAGLALGAATLFKSNLLLLVPLFVLWLAVAVPGTARRRAAAAAAMAASCGLLLLASPLANRFSPLHRAAWLPGNGGPTLWWSNNPLADGYFVDPDNTPAGNAFIDRHGLESAALETRDPAVRDRADRQLAWAWIRENPRAFVRLAGRKLWNAFGPLPRAELFSRDELAARVQALVYGSLLPLIGAGLWLSRRCLRQAMPLYLTIGSYAAMTVIFYGTPRFTLVVMPYLLAFAGLAVGAAWRWSCRRKRRTWRKRSLPERQVGIASGRSRPERPVAGPSLAGSASVRLATRRGA
ncbi:MAG: glycosyltransferase family 39 protein [Acidobacteria bacterium]|nr:glycosyltransferase family 39 protein [Acidobacteriota bacterium]